jgi:hypothetical protein
MSSVRMCDGCGVIFSEKDPDWASGSITRRKLNERTGTMQEYTEDEDRCGQCATSSTVKVPQVAIEGMTLPNQG